MRLARLGDCVKAERTRAHEGGVEVANFDMADDLDELARVRAWARAVLSDVPTAASIDIVMLLNELVSNAMRHGGWPRQVRLTRRTRTLRIEVDDASPELARRREPSDTGGHGVALVEACAERWGQERTDDGKTVWAELALPGGVAPRDAADRT